MYRNHDIPSIRLCASLRDIATDDANEGEYHPGEHNCWMAAERIEDLLAMLAGNDDATILRMIAQRIESKDTGNNS